MGRGKHDKTTRLLRVISLLKENAGGMSARGLAIGYGINAKNLYRDLCRHD
jgi:predicted DNA-binding transcriptional regulator YafY